MDITLEKVEESKKDVLYRRIGTLWIANTCFAYPELMEFIKEPGQLIGAIALGYADEVPRQRPRKTLDDIVEYHY